MLYGLFDLGLFSLHISFAWAMAKTAVTAPDMGGILSLDDAREAMTFMVAHMKALEDGLQANIADNNIHQSVPGRASGRIEGEIQGN